MKPFASITIGIASVLLMTGFKIAGHGENHPTVQSAFGGAFYLRSIPNSDYGTEGKTKCFE